jgi:hypothetical protein
MTGGLRAELGGVAMSTGIVARPNARRQGPRGDVTAGVSIR